MPAEDVQAWLLSRFRALIESGPTPPYLSHVLEAPLERVRFSEPIDYLEASLPPTAPFERAELRLNVRNGSGILILRLRPGAVLHMNDWLHTRFAAPEPTLGVNVNIPPEGVQSLTYRLPQGVVFLQFTLRSRMLTGLSMQWEARLVTAQNAEPEPARARPVPTQPLKERVGYAGSFFRLVGGTGALAFVGWQLGLGALELDLKGAAALVTIGLALLVSELWIRVRLRTILLQSSGTHELMRGTRRLQAFTNQDVRPWSSLKETTQLIRGLLGASIVLGVGGLLCFTDLPLEGAALAGFGALCAALLVRDRLLLRTCYVGTVDLLVKAADLKTLFGYFPEK